MLVFCEEETFNQSEINLEYIRDPFVSLLPTKETAYPVIASTKTETGQQATLPNLSVQGLIWGSDRPQAIINNKVYNIGDQVEGTRIIDINKEGVKISFQDKFFLVAPEKVKTISQKPIGR